MLKMKEQSVTSVDSSNNDNFDQEVLLKTNSTLHQLKKIVFTLDWGFNIIDILIILGWVFNIISGYQVFIGIILFLLLEIIVMSLPLTNKTIAKIIPILLPWENKLLSKLSQKGYLTLRNFKVLFKERKKFELKKIINQNGG